MEDFASALESFEQEQAQTEAALNEEQIVSGTVLKVTPQYVVVDIGYKSEGVVPVAEFQDHEGNVTVQRGDEIAVMREPGQHRRGLHPPLAPEGAATALVGRDREGLQREDAGESAGDRSHQGRVDRRYPRRARIPSRIAG